MNFRDFKFLELGEISTVTKLAGFEFSKYMEYVENGDIIALRAMNIKNGYLDLENIKKINRNVSDSLIRSKLYKNDIVLTYTGSKYGDSAIIKEDNKFHLAPNVAKITAITVDPYYLFSYFKSNVFREELRNFGGGSSQPTIPMKTIRKMMIPIPSLKEQKAIAKILSDLDEKIEVNNKINKNLEEMAQTIFKQWFIDFEFPNEEGKPYKSSGGEMVESELGMIPKGFKVKEFGDIINIASGKRPKNKSKEYSKETNIPLIGASSVMGFTNDFNFDTNILVIGRVGTHGVVQRFNCKVWASDNTLVIKSNCLEFSNQILKSIDYKSLNRGSTQPLITQGDIKQQKIIFPNVDLLKDFEKRCFNLMNLFENNVLENERLEKLRDTLLPKLMSGEISVPLENNEN